MERRSREQFGAIVSVGTLLHVNRLCKLTVSTDQKVATYMERRGRQTLPFLVRGTGLEPAQVREALVVLIQHRLTCYYTIVEGGKPPLIITCDQLHCLTVCN
ncbi:hypothetical protein BDF19DRAFT_70721 [Syncephalis fuscata]|nr:hypothetical protein BDF19DRAFT_70721 [Syncephalis fuscata]